MEWWRLNSKNYGKITIQFCIEWTPSKGGWVRARPDPKTKWRYKKCGCAKHAESIGLSLL